MNTTNLISQRIVGIGNQDITPEVASTLGAVLGTHLEEDSTVVLSCDFRPDSRMTKRALASGLMSTGIDVLDLHAVSIPVLQFALKRFGGCAAVSCSGEHYLPEAIRVRIFDSGGVEIGSETIPELKLDYSKNYNLRRVSSVNIGQMLVSKATEATENIYRSALLNFIERKQIVQKSFNIVVDCSLGTSSILFPSILSDLGVQVLTLNATRPTQFPKSLPNMISLRNLARVVQATNADLGIAFDGEGGRILLVDETGALVSPDVTSSLYITECCRTQSITGTAVISDTVSAILPEVISACRIERVSCIQPGAIARAIRNTHAFIGATDKGQMFFPSFVPSSDAFLAVIWILEFLTKNETSLSEAVIPVLSSMPAVSGETAVMESDFGRVLQDLYVYCNTPGKRNDLFALDTLCGVKVVFLENQDEKQLLPNQERIRGWVHVSPSSKPNRAELTIETRKGQSFNELANQTVKLIHSIIEKDEHQDSYAWYKVDSII